jgi:hypothetical protein
MAGIGKETMCNNWGFAYTNWFVVLAEGLDRIGSCYFILLIIHFDWPEQRDRLFQG